VDVTPWLKSLEDSGLATSVRNSLYIFPFVESVHVMALSLVFGTILVVDLRALGLASSQRGFTRMSSELLKITWGAFALSALTGGLMFTTNARVYAHNTAFLVKMALLALAGLNMAAFHVTAGRSVAQWDTARTAPRAGRITAALSIAVWVAIIFAGRVIGFTTTGAQAKELPQPTGNFDDFLNNSSDSGPSGPPQSSSPVEKP
jgi:hypothetical protein